MLRQSAAASMQCPPAAISKRPVVVDGRLRGNDEKGVGRICAVLVLLPSVLFFSVGLRAQPGFKSVACEYKDWEMRRAEEERCLKRASGIVRRVGDIIVVRLQDGTEQTIISDSSNSGGVPLTVFVSFDSKLNLVFFQYGTETIFDGTFSVDLTTGQRKNFFLMPIFSPSGRYALTMGTPQGHIETRFSFYIVDMRAQSETEMFACDVEPCGARALLEPRWISENKIGFSAISWNDKLLNWDESKLGKMVVPPSSDKAFAEFDGNVWTFKLDKPSTVSRTAP
jgi:hypothetical protein